MGSKYSEYLVSALEDAKASYKVIEEANRVLLTLPLREKRLVIENLRKFSLQEFVDGKYKIFEKFFRIKKGNDLSAAGMGHGEVMCLLGVKSAVSCGLSHGDIKIKNKILEVKQLSKSNQFRIGYSGNLNNSDIMYQLVLFYNILSFARIANPNIQEILDKYFLFDDCYNRIQKFFELGKMRFNAMYDGFKALHEYLKDFDSEYAICKIHDKEFVIPAKTFDKIMNTKFPANIILPIIKDVTKNDSHISIKKISEHPYVINPNKMVNDISVVSKLFCNSIDLLMFFDNDGNCTNLFKTNKYFPLCVSRVTQGMFKMQYVPELGNGFYENQKKRLKKLQN